IALERTSQPATFVSDEERQDKRSSDAEVAKPDAEYAQLLIYFKRALLLHCGIRRSDVIDYANVTAGSRLLKIPFRLYGSHRIGAVQEKSLDIAREMGLEGGVHISNLAGRRGYAVAEVSIAQRAITHISALKPQVPPSDYLSVALGETAAGKPYWIDLDQLPHLLVAGTSGSGKSYLLRGLLHQLTTFYDENDLRIVIVDGKGIGEYRAFRESPHLLDNSAYLDQRDRVPRYFKEDLLELWLPEMQKLFLQESETLAERTGKMATSLRELQCHAAEEGIMLESRPLVVVIDEFAELAPVDTDGELDAIVARFTSIGRALGAHLILATQYPRWDVVTGTIKANCARLSLQVRSSNDSIVILDEGGAEELMDNGDLLFKRDGRTMVQLQSYDVG
ncbi:DUF87 domain-containing protein, partial [Halorhodospira halochloris]|uniref:FtsK/SpoIIIE domain-containing protein n=1 Tax=Halorhodospira halochloris TaxID=1052 RepID=UPI001EE8781A